LRAWNPPVARCTSSYEKQRHAGLLLLLLRRGDEPGSSGDSLVSASVDGGGLVAGDR